MPRPPKGGEAFVPIYLSEIINGKENKVLTGVNLQCFLPQDFKGAPREDTEWGLARIGHAQMKIASSAASNSPEAGGADRGVVYFKQSVMTYKAV